MRWPWQKKLEPEPSRPLALAPERRADSWVNTTTGLGDPGRDKVFQGIYFPPIRLMDNELLALYNGNDLAARICEVRPQECMKRGYELKVEGDDEVDQEDIKELKKYGARLRLDDQFVEAGVWGNVFGGSLMIIGAQDGRNIDEPLDEENIDTVRFLNVVDRRFIFVHRYYNDPQQPNYGLPEQYLVTNAVGGVNPAPAAMVVHETRVIRFDGARTDILTRQQLAGWTWSLLQRAYDILRAFDGGFQAAANLLTDASQGVFKVDGLLNMISSGEKEALQTRMALVDMSRSTARAVLLDAEHEEFERTATSFAGIPDMLDRFMMRLSAATEIPVTILMGRSAAGMNATGDSDFRAFYDSLAVEQENKIAPKLCKLYRILSCAKDSPFAGQELEWEICFKQLWQPSDVEQADVVFKTAQADQIYATIGALTPEEIALSRWGKGKWSPTIELDVEAHKRDALEAKVQKNLQPPAEGMESAAQQGQAQNTTTTLPGPTTGTNNAGFSEQPKAFVQSPMRAQEASSLGNPAPRVPKKL